MLPNLPRRMLTQTQYPLHMLSLSSLQAFDSIIQKDENILNLDARRFRSNIISKGSVLRDHRRCCFADDVLVTGSEEYDEETWKSIRCRDVPGTEGIIFDVSCRTVRSVA